MTSRGRRSALLLSFLLTLLGVAALSAPSAVAAPHRSLSYVALGDSYAAGQGAGDYRNRCLQSRYGYPALLDKAKRIRLRADLTCTGFTTADVTAQAAGVKKNTRLVTVTVGGNDLRVSAVAAECAGGPTPACQAAIGAAQALLAVGPTGSSVLGQRLVATYGAIATQAPRALILVTGYPILFEDPAPTATDPNADTIRAVNTATVALNATIEAAVGAARSAGSTIAYVDVTKKFAGHGIGGPTPFFAVAGPDAFHPNRAGYRAYAAAIWATLSAC